MKVTIKKRLKRRMHRKLDQRGWSLVRKEKSNLAWFYPVPTTCEIANVPFFFERFFGQRHDGTYVEVGAFDGYNYSNTLGLAKQGWYGFLIEPDPSSYEKCVAQYKEQPHITVSNCAISDGSNDHVTLTRGGPLTTTSNVQVSDYRKTRFFKDLITEETFDAPAYTLDDYLTTNGVKPEFEILVVDVEGGTADVFAGFSIEKWRPKMLLVELFDVHPALRATAATDATIRRSILAAGYETIHKDAINTVFVRSDLIDDVVVSGN